MLYADMSWKFGPGPTDQGDFHLLLRSCLKAHCTDHGHVNVKKMIFLRLVNLSHQPSID